MSLAELSLSRPVIQGGMGVGVSGWRLASAVARHGGLGVVSGVAPDLMLARRLQDGDPDGDLRRALAAFPDQRLVGEVVARYLLADGRPEGTPYRPVPRLDVRQRRDAVRLTVLGAFAEVWLAKEGHDGAVGINLLEKVQAWTPAALLGAMLADVDAVLVGAGIPGHLPRLLDGLARLDPVELPLDVEGAAAAHRVRLEPAAVLDGAPEALQRPFFLAIVSSHVLAAYLCRDEATRPDGFVLEGPIAGGHNAPPRGRMVVDDSGQPVYGPRDEVDLGKVAALGLPFWLAGGYGTPQRLAEALAAGAAGVQVGTAFALSAESGMQPQLRSRLLDEARAGTLRVRTDPAASPTGFPFKVAQVPGTVADPVVLDSRDRTCDLGYLRTAFERADGTVGYRCPAEPVDAYLRKGGAPEDTVGRTCLCNALTATIGLGQRRRDGSVEPPLLTLGADSAVVEELLARHPDGWTAADVRASLTSTPV